MEEEGEQRERRTERARGGEVERKETERQPQMRTPMHAHAAAPPAESDNKADGAGKGTKKRKEEMMQSSEAQ
jgi:hypothetical protein